MKDTTDVLIKAEPVDTEEGNQAPGEYDGSGDGEDSAHHAVDDGHEIDQVGDVDDVCVILDDDEEDVETYAQEKNDNEATHEADVPEDGEGEPAGFEEMQEENTGDTVNMDNDESINLTIGEEEQKLLHDEVIYVYIYILIGGLLNEIFCFRPLTISLLSRVSTHTLSVPTYDACASIISIHTLAMSTASILKWQY